MRFHTRSIDRSYDIDRSVRDRSIDRTRSIRTPPYAPLLHRSVRFVRDRTIDRSFSVATAFCHVPGYQEHCTVLLIAQVRPCCGFRVLLFSARIAYSNNIGEASHEAALTLKGPKTDSSLRLIARGEHLSTNLWRPRSSDASEDIAPPRSPRREDAAARRRMSYTDERSSESIAGACIRTRFFFWTSTIYR